MYVAAVDKENMATLDEYLQLPNVQVAFSELTDGSIKLAWSHKNTYDEQGDGTYTLYALKGRDGLNPAMDDSGILRAEAKASMWVAATPSQSILIALPLLTMTVQHGIR